MRLRVASVSRVLIAGLVACVAGPAAFTSTAGAQTETPVLVSTRTGVFTDVQATRGEGVFQKSCAECHVASDYQGDAFKSKFVGGSAFDMFELIRTSMPQSDPGSLPRQQYADLLAYFFKLNALPAGKNELSTESDSLKAIKVEAKDSTGVRSSHSIKTPRNGLHHGSPYIR